MTVSMNDREVDMIVSSCGSNDCETSGPSSKEAVKQLMPADLLKLIQTHATKDMKYCLPMVPMEEE